MAEKTLEDAFGDPPFGLPSRMGFAQALDGQMHLTPSPDDPGPSDGRGPRFLEVPNRPVRCFAGEDVRAFFSLAADHLQQLGVQWDTPLRLLCFRSPALP